MAIIADLPSRDASLFANPCAPHDAAGPADQQIFSIRKV
jgi:hypothetical protein